MQAKIWNATATDGYVAHQTQLWRRTFNTYYLHLQLHMLRQSALKLLTQSGRRHLCTAADLPALLAAAKIVKEPLPLEVGLPSALVGPSSSKRRMATTSGAAPPCTYALRHPDAPGGVLAALRRHDLVLHTATPCQGLSISDAAPLVSHALELLWPEQVRAIATLPGLPSYVASLEDTLDAEFGPEAGLDAVRSVVRFALEDGAPEPDAETIAAARPVWGVMADRYAALPEAEEAELYRGLGAESIGMACFADPTKEGLRASGGACALFAWPLDSKPDGGYAPIDVSSLESIPKDKSFDVTDHLKSVGVPTKE